MEIVPSRQECQFVFHFGTPVYPFWDFPFARMRYFYFLPLTMIINQYDINGKEGKTILRSALG